MIQRRRLLQLGVGASVILAVAGPVVSLMHPGLAGARLAPASKDILHAVARAVLDHSLPDDAAEREAALKNHLVRVDDAVAGFPPATREELSRLLSLLHSAAGRLALARLTRPWHEASTDALQQALQSMRLSSLSLRQQAYHALRDLTNAAYYADARAWPRIGYPGPRQI